MHVFQVRVGRSMRQLLLRSAGWLVLVVFVAGQTLNIPSGRGDPLQTRTGIVALVVDERVWDDRADRPDAIGGAALSLRQRVERYARDVQAALPWTRTTILSVSSREAPERIARTLERLYFEGSEDVSGLSQLTGVVLIGDVPLPVVEKDGVTYESVYPYVDFLDKAFLFDAFSGRYRAYRQAGREQAEAWHGVIRLPRVGTDPLGALAAFFDKNHAYHAGDPAYAQVDRKVFFADLQQEPQRVGAEGFLPYQLFLQYLEDIVYERYTARLLRELTLRMQGSMDTLLAAEGIVTESGEALKDLDKIPDRYTKQPIEQMLRRFAELLGAYLGEVADVVAGSGRWNEEDAVTFPRQITIRDEAGAQAMKAANDRLSTFERPVNLFQLPAEATRTVADARREIDRILTENELAPTLLTSDGLDAVLVEALTWRSLDIAGKYETILRQEVLAREAGQAVSPYAGPGYESAYFVVGPGVRDTLELPRLQEGPFAERDEEYEVALESVERRKGEATTALSEAQLGLAPGAADLDSNGNKDACGSMTDGVPLPQWFPAIMCWLRNLLPPKITFTGDGRGSRFSLRDNASVRADDDPVDSALSGPLLPRTLLSQAWSLRLTADKDSLAVGGDGTAVTVEVLDQRGEPFRSFAGSIRLRPTVATATSAVVEAASGVTNGAARFTVRSTERSGPIHLLAEGDDGLLGVLALRAYGANAIGTASPLDRGPLPVNALYVTVAGSDAVAKDALLAERILYSSGKAQAVTSLAVPERLGRDMLDIGPDGIALSDATTVDVAVDSSPSLPLAVRLSDATTGTTIAVVTYAVSYDAPAAVGRPATNSREGVLVTDTSDDAYAFAAEGGTVRIRRENVEVGRLRGNGTMDLPDGWRLELPTTDDQQEGWTTFLLTEEGRTVAQMALRTEGLSVVPDDGARGDSIRVAAPSRQYQVTAFPGRIVVRDADDQASVRHSFASLNNRDEEPWSGWRGDFINQLLFAAGNAVGEAARHHASSTVLTLGDPTVQLDHHSNPETNGYTKDVGSVVTRAYDEPVRQAFFSDINADGFADVFTLRGNGTVELDMNYNRGTAFKPMGAVLVSAERIRQIVPIDLDADGWEDLLALREDGRLQAYTNRVGAYQETELPFPSPERLLWMDAADFDADGRRDLLALGMGGELSVRFAEGRGYAAVPTRLDTLVAIDRPAIVIERQGAARPNVLVPFPDQGSLVRYLPVGNGRTFEKTVTPIPPAPTDMGFADADGNGVPDAYDSDVNGDGIPDLIEQDVLSRIAAQPPVPQSAAFNLGATADRIGAKIDEAMRNLCPKKTGGCPKIFGYNKAFFAPGYSTVVGPLGNTCTQGPLLDGRPVVSIPPGFLSVFRLYVMPTLTGGVGIAACFGKKQFPFLPPPALQNIPLLGNCFVRSFNPLSQACSGLQVLYDQLWNRARGIVRGAGGVNLFQVGLGAQGQPTTFDNGTYTDRTKDIRNVRPKAFPGFIMTWVERQVEEITTKLTDLPSVTLILPDFSDTFVPKDGQVAEIRRERELRSIGDALKYLDSLPFLNIKVDDLNVKYPAVPRQQLALMKEYYEQWAKDAEEELSSFRARADVTACLGNNNRVVATGTGVTVGERCSVALPNLDLRIAAGERTIQRVKSNLQRLQEYAEFPKTVEKLVNYKTEIIRQTTGYLDRIANVMGGYYLRNKRRVVKWQEMYRLIKEILKGWQLLPEVFTQYRNACTTCRNDRGNYMDCRMDKWKFVLAPIFSNLPIIPFPKWPDIVIDVSNINAVVNIHLPNPRFIPQPVVLPKLQPFRVPDLNFETGLGNLSSDQLTRAFEKDLDVLIPKLPALPEVPDFLPKLPNLPLPQLPDIPPPPKIPKIAGSLTTVLRVAKVVLKVWCLYKKGIPLIPEQNVKGVVEYQTERSNFIRSDFLDVFLPEPKLPYVDQIRVDAFVNFTLNADQLRRAAAAFVQPYNAMVTNMTRATVPLHQILDSVPQLPDEIRMGATNPQIDAVAQDEREAHERLARESAELVDIDALRDYVQAQRDELARELPSSLEVADDEPSEAAQQPYRNERVEQMRREIADLQNTTDQQVRSWRAVWEGGPDEVSRALQAPLARLASTGPLAADAPAQREIAPSRALALLPDVVSAPEDLRNAAWGSPNTTDGSWQGVAPSADSPVPSVIGEVNDLFLYNESTRVPERLIAYDGEEDIGTLADSADIDGDGREDALYNLGGVIMIKRNIRSGVAPYYYDDAPIVRRLSDTPDPFPSANYVRTTDGYRFLGLFWHYEPMEGRIGYRLRLRPTIDSFDRERAREATADRTVTVYFAIPGGEDQVRRLLEDDPTALPDLVVLNSDTAESAPLRLPPGTSFGRFESLVREGAGGVRDATDNEVRIAAPRDDNPAEQPVAVVAGGNFRRVPVLQSTVLDGRLSYKTGGTITKYAWDLHPAHDTDGDGLTDNDADSPLGQYAPVTVTEAYNEPMITLGALLEPGRRDVVLTVTDDAGNTARTTVTIETFVPTPVIDAVTPDDGSILGHLDPRVPDEPVAVLRERGGQVSLLSHTAPGGRLRTDGSGAFVLAGLPSGDGTQLLDAQGRRVALVDQQRRSILVADDVQVRLLAADDGLPFRLELSRQDNVLGWVSLAVAATPRIAEALPETASGMTMLLDTDASDGTVLRPVPVAAPSYGGGVLAYEATQAVLLAAFGVDGNVASADESVAFGAVEIGRDPRPLRASLMRSGSPLALVAFPWTIGFLAP